MKRNERASVLDIEEQPLNTSLSLCVSIHGERFVGKLVSAACAVCWHGVGIPYTLVVLAPPVSTAAAAADV